MTKKIRLINGPCDGEEMDIDISLFDHGVVKVKRVPDLRLNKFDNDPLSVAYHVYTYEQKFRGSMNFYFVG